MLKPGAVVGGMDQISAFALNPGSVLATDRTQDSNLYGFFMAMSIIGNTLSRYGNTSATTGGGWGQGSDLIWTDLNLVKGDSTGSACGLASAFLNFIDGFTQVQSTGVLGSGGAAVNLMTTGLQAAVVVGGVAPCATSGGLYACEKYYSPVGAPSVQTQARCNLAMERLRYRGACAEKDEAAIFAAGMIQCINAIWL
jgi:hypothetical protein